ncbi:MAG TPA: DUF4142 domain-containing protein [Edaphobacter sp.]|jgi:putative membrane protein
MRRTGFTMLVFCSVVAFELPLLSQSSMTQPPASQTQPNQPGRVSPPTTSMQDSSGAPSDTAQQMKDKMFVRNAVQGSLAEIELGKLAAGKGSSEDVKAFGQKMVEDHGKLNEEMGQLADSIGARMPKKMSKEQKSVYDKLNSLSGEEFDKEYIACMMKDHHADLREFRMEASSTNDPDVQEAVDKAARVIREHMVTIDKMARERGIPMPGHHRPPAAESSAEAPPPSQ